jgi:ketosteroid isomerase-like protein
VSTEENRSLVTETWKRLLGGDVSGALTNVSEDATWWISGTLPGVSGTKKGKAEIEAFFGGVQGAFPGGLKTDIRRTYCDGNTVVIELVNRGTSVSGKPYENEYCFVFELAGGKIRAIREYVDLDKARAAVSP